ncbi:MAG: ABC transporter substrate-binding protein [Notoacmeibacter sp.]
MNTKFALIGFFACLAWSAKAETLVVAAPFTEFPILAAQMVDGAQSALSGNWVVKPIDAGCKDENVGVTIELIMAEKPDAIIGLPCIETLVPALKAFGPIGIPIVTIASQAIAPSNLAIENKWLLFRTGPREKAETQAISKLIVAQWANFRFAILDDGTIFSRDIAEAMRNEAETQGFKPVLVDGFQPQLENQRKLIEQIASSGATHVFLATDRANMAQIAKEAASLNLTFAGPETLKANDLDFPLPAGVLMAARDLTLTKEAEAKIVAGRQTPFTTAEGYSADAFVAAELVMALKLDSSVKSFNSASGRLAIAADGFVDPVHFALYRFNGFEFQKVTP